MDIQKNNFLSIEQVKDQYLNQKKTVTTPVTPSISFNDILKAKSLETADKSELRFSKHAENRLSDRNITLSKEQLNRLNSGARKASEKGINESLVMVDSLAFIVNVKNNTVITAMDSTDSNENIYTNIDGAVIM